MFILQLNGFLMNRWHKKTPAGLAAGVLKFCLLLLIDLSIVNIKLYFIGGVCSSAKY